MHAKTTVARSKSFANDRIWLNGTEENIENPRLANCLKEIRKKAQIDAEEHFHICSENNFPTAAGLASSAAGYACLGKYWPRATSQAVIVKNLKSLIQIGFWFFILTVLLHPQPDMHVMVNYWPRATAVKNESLIQIDFDSSDFDQNLAIYLKQMIFFCYYNIKRAARGHGLFKSCCLVILVKRNEWKFENTIVSSEIHTIEFKVKLMFCRPLY